MKKCLKLIFLNILFIKTSLAVTHQPEVFLTKIRGQQDEGQQIVQHFCANCHAEKPLIELGAPKIGVLMDWEIRMKQGFTKVFAHTAEGLGAMPARGGCFECTDKQLQLAILAMLPLSLQKELNNSLKENK
ncbi:c-type cytochrome [Legionella gresilensis]|uniref:c-type cytochrome n=1 Tax=Legionella gresilensis TaxID=91823 RepID=UPI001040EB25|nr:c-type cytochrome [Legionella gresilensis]